MTRHQDLPFSQVPMTEVRKPLVDSPQAFPHFAGSSPVLRVFAWVSVLFLVVGWAVLLLGYVGVAHPSSGSWVGGSLLIAFVAGISSFCPLGGIGAALVVLTVFVSIVIGVGGGSC